MVGLLLFWGTAVGEAVGLSVLIGSTGLLSCLGMNAKTEISKTTTIATDRTDFAFKLSFSRFGKDILLLILLSKEALRRLAAISAWSFTLLNELNFISESFPLTFGYNSAFLTDQGNNNVQA
jgi:hypothetical protein